MKFPLLACLFLATQFAAAQSVSFARKIVDTLTSANFWGRGYTNNGAAKAADFLTARLKSYGVKPMNGNNFIQEFSYDVNTFPGEMDVAVNGVELVPGKDYIVRADSRGVKAEANLVQKDSAVFLDIPDRVIVVLEDKLTWSAAQHAVDFTVIEVAKSALKNKPVYLKAAIENKLVTGFKTGNICGIVKGYSKPDSVIVYTAHYDHLGGMGSKTYFPGANDNASGVAQVLLLAKYYSAHPQPYTMGFILFSGEEAGLVGSNYFSENPLIPLSNIRFLVNLDLEGTGIDGITVVNAATNPGEFSLLKQVNEKYKLFAKINSRGKAANSDHYPFSQKGVPAFYIYTLGGIRAYHDVYDVSATLPLNEFDNEFKLLLKFNDALMNKK